MTQPPDPPHDPLADQRIRTACLVILACIAVGAALILLRPVLVPLLVALLFTYCLKPVIDFQVKRLGFPRYVALGGAAVVALALLAVAAGMITAFAIELRESFPKYRDRLGELARQVTESVPLQRLGMPDDPAKLVRIPEQSVQHMLGTLIGPLTDIVSGIGLVLIFVLFLLIGGGNRPLRAGSLLAEIEVRAQRYILQMVGFSVVTGLLVGVSLGLVGVKFAFAFGFLAFLLNFIPTIGPLLAILLPLPVVLLDADLNLTQKILAFALPTGIQLAFAVIQPRVQGGGQDLHPVMTMAALVFFGSIWGILGAALAVPVTGVIKIILERIPTTRPVANWMAGRFDPLPPDEPPPPGPPASPEARVKM